MAAGKISQVVEVKVTGADDVKALEKDLGKLDGSKTKVNVDADTKAAQKSVDEFINDIKGLDKNNYTVALALKDTDLQAQLSDILEEIAQADGSEIDISAKIEQANQVSADIDKIETKIKEVNATPIDVDTTGVVESTGHAKAGIDEVGKSAESSKSVLANMIGNSTQDLGQLGGVAGSAGVAIGQMGEYMADAALAGEGLGSVLKSFGAVAGPLALVAVAVQGITTYFKIGAEEEQHAADVAKFHATQVDVIAKALEDGSDAAKAYADHLAEVGKVEATISGSHILPATVDVSDAMLKVGASAKTYSEAVTGSDADMQRFTESVRASGADVHDQNAVLLAATQAHKDYADGVKQAAKFNDLFAPKVAESAQMLAIEAQARDEYNARQAGTAAAAEQSAKSLDLYNKKLQDEAAFTAIDSQQAQQHAEDIQRVGQQYDDALAAQTQFQNTLKSADWGHAAVAGGVTAMEEYSTQLNSLKDIAAAAEEAQDSFTESIKKNGFTFDVSTEKGRANQKSLEDLGQTIDVKLGAAYASADGNQQAFIDSATKLGEDTLAKLKDQMHLSTGQVDQLRVALGLMPEDLETRYKLSGDEEAKAKLQLLQGSIDALPKDVQAKITQQIVAGDYQGAVSAVQTYFAQHPVAQKVDVHAPSPDEMNEVTQKTNAYLAQHPATLPVRTDARIGPHSEGGVVGPEGGTAAEVGPEFITDPHGRTSLLVAPSVVAPGTVVTSTAQTANLLGGLTVVEKAQPTIVYVTINTGVIGNRYDLDRTVRRSVQNGVRLAGARAA